MTVEAGAPEPSGIEPGAPPERSLACVRPGREPADRAAVEQLDVSAYTLPTETPESDGTLVWDSTTVVVVEATAAGRKGLGFSYTDPAAAALITHRLADIVCGRDPMAVGSAWRAMLHAVRNIGRPGLAASAIAAVDAALWDLKARLLDLPLVTLLGAVRDGVPVYASGGFTSYPVERLREEFGALVERGIRRVKMKVGRVPEDDVRRVRAAREAVGAAELYVDANGAYDRKQALAFAERFAHFNVTWFEEPVSSDDLEGLRLIRDRAPPGMEIAAGEYGYDIVYYRRMLESGAVDVLQADATRCAGITGFLEVAALCEAYMLPLSAHTAPSLHLHPCCALAPVRHLEYFRDHVRIEHLLFDGVADPDEGMLYPDLARPGLGLELKRRDAERFRVR